MVRNQILPVLFSMQHKEQQAMASEKNLQKLFHETLKDICFAEKKLLSALPEMANAAQSRDLKAAFELHETETEEHVARLRRGTPGGRRAAPVRRGTTSAASI
jgi:hypothetical protein